MKKYSNPDGLTKPTVYTQVVETRGGRTIYIAGQVAWDEEGNTVGDDVYSQAVQVVKNLKTAIESVGGTLADLVKVTIYIVDYQPEKRQALTAAAAKAFGDNPPISTLIGVQALARPDLLIEIDGIAVIDD